MATRVTVVGEPCEAPGAGKGDAQEIVLMLVQYTSAGRVR